MRLASDLNVVVVGGCGHVGLPLGLAFAGRGLDVGLYDTSRETVREVASGTMPFHEDGAQEVLDRVVGSKLEVSSDPAMVSRSEAVIVVVGTPVDEHLNPDAQAVPHAVVELLPHLRDGQLLILRSTVYPGVTRMVEKAIARSGKRIDVAFCPERIAEGKAMVELYELPQIISARSRDVIDRAAKLFSTLTSHVVELDPEEAELAKLFTNTWRYIKFATANQLYMIANNFGLDYERIRTALTDDYPRAKDLPSAGFAAGPCLLKDTMQLAAFNNNDFTLGHASMTVNEGLPLYLVARLEEQHDLEEMTVGILGMAFKGESDDTRSSLAYKLKRILRFKAEEVLCTDPYVTNDLDLVPLEEVLDRAELLIIAAPHERYADLDTRVPVADIWNIRGTGVRV